MNLRGARSAFLVALWAGFCASASGAARVQDEALEDGAIDVETEVSTARDPIFDRVPAELPRAAEGHWADWTGQTPPAEELRDLVQGSVLAYQARDYPRAMTALYELLERAPDYPPALFQLGTVFFRLRRYGDSRLVLERFIEVAPQEVAITQALAHGLYSLGDYEAAVAHYERVLAAGIQSLEVHRGLGLARMRLGDLEGALSELDKVVAGNPAHGDAWAWKARVLYDLDRPEEALEPARKGVEHLAFEPRPWFVLSQVLADLGEDAEAESAYERFEELTAHIQLVRHEEGILLFDPRSLDAFVRLIDHHQKIGDLAAVRTTFARAFQAHPDETRLRFWSLEVLLAMNDKEGARVSAKAIEDCCGEDPETWRQLELFYGRIKDVEAQIRCGERYLRLSGGKPR